MTHDHQTPAERRIIEDMSRMGRNGQMDEWADDDDPKLRALFQYQLRTHVRHQDGRESLAPTLVFADADYEVGDGVCGLHADAKSANEPAIVFVRADDLVDAAKWAVGHGPELDWRFGHWKETPVTVPDPKQEYIRADHALEAVKAEARAEALDAAHKYLCDQYGNSPLGHPIDRKRILALIPTDQEENLND